MALVWYVDKKPRSRKPVQYRQLDSFANLGRTGSEGLLPVLLPCPLCAANQQLTTSAAASQCYNKRGRRPKSKFQRELEDKMAIANKTGSLASIGLKSPTSSLRSSRVSLNSSGTDNKEYEEFIELCKHVECMVEKSIAKISPTLPRKNPDNKTHSNPEDDVRNRFLRDRNRSQSPHQPISQKLSGLESGVSTKNHYAWRSKSDLSEKYKSQFNPMREHDLVRDDLAVRKWVDKKFESPASKSTPSSKAVTENTSSLRSSDSRRQPKTPAEATNSIRIQPKNDLSDRKLPSDGLDFRSLTSKPPRPPPKERPDDRLAVRPLSR